MDHSQSFTARRSAASNLPTFQLPPPDLSSMHKYPNFQSAGTTQQNPSAAALTPPAGNDGLSPLSSGANSGSSQSSTSGIPPYNNSSLGNFWPQTTSSYTFSSNPQMSSSFNQQYMGRPLYSPSMFPPRNSNSPTAGEALPPPPYELNLPPFPSSMPMSGAGNVQTSLPTLAPQQAQQQLANVYNNSQPAVSQASHHATVQAPEPYGGRPPPTPTTNYYAPASTPQSSTYPAYAQHSPTSPNNSGTPQNRISPVSINHHSPMSNSQQQSQYRPYNNGYSLPAMSGPIMSNVHSPGSQMALVGGMNMSGYPQQYGGMYGHPSHPQPQNDRPFKCDQCPQSFNRNHDLKRHKRIHLAVKPFPCGHCEKSFSRKDALKRHILVKGCGNSGSEARGSTSPLDKSEVMSDSTEDSPVVPKRQL